MNTIRSYTFLWWCIPVLFIPMIMGTDTYFDLQLHDTYIVFGTLHLSIIFSIVLVVLGGLYWLLKDYPLIMPLKFLHVLGTPLLVLGFVVLAILQTIYRGKDFEMFQQLISFAAMLFIIFIVLQCLFILNLMFGIVRSR